MESRVDACHPERSRGICTWTFVLLSNYGTRILNGDSAERAGLAPLRVELHAPAQRFSASTVPKSLMVRWRDLSATRSESCRFRGIAVNDPRSVVAEPSA